MEFLDRIFEFYARKRFYACPWTCRSPLFVCGENFFFQKKNFIFTGNCFFKVVIRFSAKFFFPKKQKVVSYSCHDLYKRKIARRMRISWLEIPNSQRKYRYLIFLFSEITSLRSIWADFFWNIKCYRTTLSLRVDKFLILQMDSTREITLEHVYGVAWTIWYICEKYFFWKKKRNSWKFLFFQKKFDFFLGKFFFQKS